MIPQDLFWRDPRHAPVFDLEDPATLHCTSVSMGDISTPHQMSCAFHVEMEGFASGSTWQTLPGILPWIWEDFCSPKRDEKHDLGPVSPHSYSALLNELLEAGNGTNSYWTLPIGTWRLCITPGGRPALVPADTRYDDQLVLLLDANVPFVVRWCGTEHEGHEKHFTLVGPAYVHGLDIVETIRRAHESRLDNLQRIVLT